MKSRTVIFNTEPSASAIDEFINATPGDVVDVTLALAAGNGGGTLIVNVLYLEE